MNRSHQQTAPPPNARFCPNCQAKLPPEARFCMRCGHPLSASTPTDDARLARLVAAVPAPLVDKVRAAAHLAGERRVVTVLFADIVGSTALAEQVDGQVWAAIMNRTFDRIAPVIYRYEGTIARLLGDAVVAFFGAPVAHEDDPLRAVRAALDLLAAAREVATTVRQEHGIEFAMRACLSTGPVIVESVGGDLKYAYTAIDGVVNLAARIKFVAQPMTVLVSENTWRFVAPVFVGTDLGLIEVKDRAEPMRVYQVHTSKVEPGQVRGLAGLQSPLVGRDAELATLDHLGEAVRAGLGRAVLLAGEPGLGKTRLIAEWKAIVANAAKTQRAEASSLQWVEGHCLSYGHGLAYHLLIDLLHSLLGIPAAAGESALLASLIALSKDLFGDAALDVYPYLGHMLSLTLEGAALERVRHLDPQALQAQYLASLQRLLRALAARRPLVLIIEDLHWADPSSIELLVKLLPLVSTTPLLFCLVTRLYRDAPGWKLVAAAREAMGGSLTELRLDVLPETDSQQLVSNLLKIEATPRQMQTLILERAQGNPFFIEEVIRMLIDRGALVQKDGKWVAGAEIARLDIPENLQGLLLARIDHLPDDVKHTLRVASVVGRQFPLTVLQQVLGTGELEMTLVSRLSVLESAGLIRVAQVQPELAYLFQHTLVQEVAYGSLLKADRQRLHLTVGETLELVYPERQRELAFRLGQHFYEGGDNQRALKYFIVAGDEALASYANQEAESRYRRALDLVHAEPQRAALLFGLGQALYWQSRFKEAIQTWGEGIVLYQALGDDDGVARLYGRSARAAWGGGDTPESLRLCQKGLAAVAGAPESPGLALLVHEAARATLFNGLADKARPLCQRALEMADRLGIVQVQADALATLGLLPNQPPEAALAALRRAVELAEPAGLLSQAARAHVNLAAILSTGMLDFQAALDHYQQAAEQHRRRGNTGGQLLGLGGAIDSLLKLGDLAQVEATLLLMRQLLDQVADPGPAAFIFRDSKAMLHRYRGELAEAACLLRALQVDARRRNDLHILNEVDSQLADVLLESQLAIGGELLKRYSTEAQDALLEAIQICERWKLSATYPRCLLSEVRVRQGQIKDARRLLAEAQEMAGLQPIEWEEIWLSIAKARVAAVQNRWPEALMAFEAAAKICARLGMRWWWAHTLQEWAGVHSSRGEAADLERARALLREALALFEELGVSCYVTSMKDRLQALRAETYAQALVHQKVARELAVAGRIQEGLLPGELPHIPGWQLAATLEPAGETSGDFYDLIPLANGQLGILIADVADKGMGAALYMALSRTLIRMYAAEYDTQPELVLDAANRHILMDTRTDLFVTVFYGILDLATGRLTYCNAGHNPPYLFHGQNSDAVQMLRRTGIPLGMFEEMTWEQKTVQIAPGDRLVLYTDGVTEAQNQKGTFFGEQRLLAVVQANQGRSAQNTTDALMAEVHEFVGTASPFDDITLMVVVRSSKTPSSI